MGKQPKVNPTKGSQNGHQGFVVLFFGFLGDREPVDDRQDAEAAAGEQFQDAHAGFAQHKAVNAQAAEKDGDQQQQRGLSVYHL